MTAPLDIPQSAGEQLEREFLQIRARILELAAALDRLQRAEGAADTTSENGRSEPLSADPRMALIRQGLTTLAVVTPDRAEQVQLLFSRPYDPKWQTAFRRDAKSQS